MFQRHPETSNTSAKQFCLGSMWFLVDIGCHCAVRQFLPCTSSSQRNAHSGHLRSLGCHDLLQGFNNWPKSNAQVLGVVEGKKTDWVYIFSTSPTSIFFQHVTICHSEVFKAAVCSLSCITCIDNPPRNRQQLFLFNCHIQTSLEDQSR